MGELTDDPYADGSLYDLEYAHHDEDIDWYVLQARHSEGPVLELGCGTGRLTLPIARAGPPITGVDRAPAMLSALRQKLEREPVEVRNRVTLRQGDYLHALDAGSFGAVLWPFNALHHCADEHQLGAMLRAIRDRTSADGRLALDCYLPDLDLYDRDPNARYENRLFQDPRTGKLLHSWEQGWWDAEHRVHHVLYVYRHEDGREERSHLRLRMFGLDELRALLHDNGWSIVHDACDFVGTPVDEQALKWVVSATPAGR